MTTRAGIVALLNDANRAIGESILVAAPPAWLDQELATPYDTQILEDAVAQLVSWRVLFDCGSWWFVAAWAFAVWWTLFAMYMVAARTGGVFWILFGGMCTWSAGILLVRFKRRQRVVRVILEMVQAQRNICVADAA